MKYYAIDLADQTKTSWALHEVVKNLPKQPRPEGMPPVFYKFFPSADVEMRMKPQYQPLCCIKCGRFEADKMFESGFDDPVTMRFEGDYGHTQDRIFSISEKFLKVLKNAKTGGYEIKPLGSSGWHALRVTLRVAHDDDVIGSSGPNCSVCGRPKESFGLFKYLSELDLPSQANTFFTTDKDWPSCHASDRDIFITENVLEALKEGGITGGYCSRLWTEDEYQKQNEKEKQGVKFWKPPGTLVHLNGKGLKK